MAIENRRRWIVLAGLILGAVSVSAQAPAQPKGDDTLAALLVEVKGLRAAMEQMASTGPRIQLFLGRLQLQEARVNSMARRLDTVRDALAGTQRGLEAKQAEQARLEREVAEGIHDPEEARMAQTLLGQLKREVAGMRDSVTRLMTEEGQLMQEITVEQGRWSDINQRLDDLERALVKR